MPIAAFSATARQAFVPGIQARTTAGGDTGPPIGSGWKAQSTLTDFSLEFVGDMYDDILAGLGTEVWSGTLNMGEGLTVGPGLGATNLSNHRWTGNGAQVTSVTSVYRTTVGDTRAIIVVPSGASFLEIFFLSNTWGVFRESFNHTGAPKECDSYLVSPAAVTIKAYDRATEPTVSEVWSSPGTEIASASVPINNVFDPTAVSHAHCAGGKTCFGGPDTSQNPTGSIQVGAVTPGRWLVLALDTTLPNYGSLIPVSPVSIGDPIFPNGGCLITRVDLNHVAMAMTVLFS